MSIKYEYETVIRTITEKRVAKQTLVCDVCGKELNLPTPHWHITIHNEDDWSYDGDKAFDVCSAECLRRKFEEYIKASNDDNNTEWIEIEHVC